MEQYAWRRAVLAGQLEAWQTTTSGTPSLAGTPATTLCLPVFALVTDVNPSSDTGRVVSIQHLYITNSNIQLVLLRTTAAAQKLWFHVAGCLAFGEIWCSKSSYDHQYDV